MATEPKPRASESPLEQPNAVGSSSSEPSVHGFPSTFTLYYKKSPTGITLSIGEPDSTPQFIMTSPAGGLATPDLTLYHGPDDSAPRIAFARLTSALSNDSEIILDARGARLAIREKLVQHAGWRHLTYRFAMVVGGSRDTLPEKFEWRRTHGESVKGLGELQWGWKLVRLAVEGSGKESAGDGKEVVAVWADSARLNPTKLAKFQFVGSGATGELGEAWTIMAVFTMARMASSQHRGSITAAAT